MSILRYNGKIVRYNNIIIRYNYVPEFYNTGTIVNYINSNISDIKNVLIHIRHAGRPLDDWSFGVHLTEMGVAESLAMGNALKKLAGDITYRSTGVVRASETALYISKGREDGILSTIDDVLPINFGVSFVKDQTAYDIHDAEVGFYNLYKNYCYKNMYLDAFYNLAERTDTYINQMINNNETSKILIAVSHDVNTFPLVAHLCKNVKLDLPENWINFITGITVIVYNNNEIEYLPITGMTTGYFKV